MSLICPLGTIDSGLADQLDLTWGDPDTWTAQGLHWTHLPEIRAAINRKVSGDASVQELRTHSRPGNAAASDGPQAAAPPAATTRVSVTTATAPPPAAASQAALAP